MSNLDPVFGLRRPLLFAHRGGAKDVPESTEYAFTHARRVGADVLELDVGVTADDELVVWHGPSLHNVHILGENPIASKRKRGRRDLHDFSWKEDLDGKAWVADPTVPYESLDEILTTDDRRLLRFEDFLKRFPDAALNVELKRSVEERHLKEVARLLETHGNDRPILIARNLSTRLLDRLQTEMPRPLLRNIPGLQLLGLVARANLGLPLGDLRRRAVQIPYPKWSATQRLIDRVHRQGGAIHVFLTSFTCLVKDLEMQSDEALEHRVRALLDLGVDGIMTDRPQFVGSLMKEWK